MSREGAVPRGPWALAAAALALAPCGARAQDAPVMELDEVVVRSPRAEAPADPTAAATIVSADRFAGEAKGVAALVATAPGVAVQEYGGLGQMATASIRGSTADGVLVLVDGLPLNTAFGGGVDLASIPRAWIERIEIVRGVEGAAYGAGALGGVLNVVTRSRGASAEISAGSFRTFALAADGTADAAGWTLGAALGASATSGAFPYLLDLYPNLSTDALVPAVRENNAALRGGLLVKAARALGAARLDAMAQVSGGRREIPGSDGAPSTDAQRDGRVLVAARIVRPAATPWLDVAGRAWARADALDVTLAPAPPDRQRDLAGGAAGEAVVAHPAGALRVALDLGGEVLRAEALGGERSRGSVALSLSDEIAVAAARVAPAVRIERVGPYGGWSAKLGASVRLAPSVAVRASAGRTFRAPSFAELYLTQALLDPNPDLRPEQGVGADAALVYDGPLGLASVGGFATLYEDLVLYQPAGPAGRLAPSNAGKALVDGLEAELATAPLRSALGLSCGASYTFTLSEILRGPADELGKDLPRRPRQRLYARAGIDPGPVEAHVEVHWVGRQFEDARNFLPIPAALVWNAGASAAVPGVRAVRLHVDVKNLLDDRALEDPYANPLPGRMVMVTLRAATPTEGAP